MSECPTCGLDVLVADGAITPHLNPDTLTPCKAKATQAAKTEEPKKAPAKATTKATKTSKS